MKNGKQIQFVTNARINKFYEIAPRQCKPNASTTLQPALHRIRGEYDVTVSALFADVGAKSVLDFH